MASLLLRRAAAGLLSAAVLTVIPAWQTAAEAASSQANPNGQANSNSPGNGTPVTPGPPSSPGAVSNGNGNANGNANGTGNGNANGNANGNGIGNGNANGNGNPGSGVAATHGLGASQSTSGAGNAPPGNNGHIQIEELDGAPADNEHGNDPHVSCAGFIVAFFGYDGGPQQATLILTPWAPTRGTPSSPIGPVSWNIGTRTNGDQLDASYTVSGSQLASVLSSATPVAQGYHLRVEVEVTGSQGSDDKFHMLWIAPCTTTGGVTPPTDTPSVPTNGATVEGLLGLAVAQPPVSTAGATASQATVGDDSRPRSGLAFTGADLAAMAFAGLLALVSGAGILLLQRRRKRLVAVRPPTG
jgi:LPXTG-motif cell wall-anchored protein